MNEMTLSAYISEHYNGVRVDFAKAQGVQPAQVSAWLRQDLIIRDHKMYIPEKHKLDLEKPKSLKRSRSKKK